MRDPIRYWLGYSLAIEHVQQARNVSRAVAQKALDEAIAADLLRTKPLEREWSEDDESHVLPEGPSIAGADFERWLDAPPKALGKQPLVIELLRKRFGGELVPDPAHCPRKLLLAELRSSHKSLGSLNDDTLKKSIDRYNASIRNDPNRINLD